MGTRPAALYYAAMRRCLPIVLAVALAPVAASGADPIPGPINARVVSVYDGDTSTVDAAPWPGVTIRTRVRVAGLSNAREAAPSGGIQRISIATSAKP